MVRAHIELAKTEANEIKDEILRTLALGGLAAIALIFVVFLLLIGLFLFLGEWLFGSLGWGVLLGTEFLDRQRRVRGAGRPPIQRPHPRVRDRVRGGAWS